MNSRYINEILQFIEIRLKEPKISKKKKIPTGHQDHDNSQYEDMQTTTFVLAQNHRL